MSKTFKHQDVYDYLHDNKKVIGKRLMKLKAFFRRINDRDYFSEMQRFKTKRKEPIG